MKQFINIYIISFVLILSQLSLFSVLQKTKDTVAERSLIVQLFKSKKEVKVY